MTDEQTAAEIMKSLWIKTRRDSAGKSMDYWIGGTFRGTVEEAMKDRADIEAAIVRALQAARESAIDTHANAAVLRMCHEARMMNGIVDYSDPNAVGVVRKLKGEFPITADGVMVQLGEDVWHPESGEALRVGEYEGDTDHNKMPLADDCTFCAFYSHYEIDTGYSEYEVYDVRQCYSTPEAAEAAKEGSK